MTTPKEKEDAIKRTFSGRVPLYQWFTLGDIRQLSDRGWRSITRAFFPIADRNTPRDMSRIQVTPSRTLKDPRTGQAITVLRIKGARRVHAHFTVDRCGPFDGEHLVPCPLIAASDEEDEQTAPIQFV